MHGASGRVANRPLKVCFSILYGYSLFDTTTRRPFGGSEVRGAYFAKALAKSPDFDVSVVTFNFGQPPVQRIDGVEVWADIGLSPIGADRLTNYRWLAKDIFSRLSHGKAANINGYGVSPRRFTVFDQIDADVYCIIGVTNVAAEIAEYCRLRGKKFVLFSGSDEDFSELYYPNSQEVNPYGNIGHLADFAIRQADLIFAQTQTQADLCKSRFGREATVLRNPFPLGSEMPSHDLDDRSGYILWIGKSDRTKQPGKVLELARLLPEVPFVLVMNKSLPTYHQKVLQDQLPNTDIVESVPFAEIQEFFRRASFLCTTSRWEGFPNTFLQAGEHGLPILSTGVDPDGFVQNFGCGVVVRDDIGKLAEEARRLLDSKAQWAECSKNIASYVRRVHRLEDKAEILCDAFRALGQN